MKLRLIITWFFVASIVAAAIYAAQSASPNGVIASNPVYNPDMSHQNQRLPDSVLQWDAVMKTTNILEGSLNAHFNFYFTNVYEEVNRTQVTNIALVVYSLPSNPLLSPHEQKMAPKTRAVTVTNVVWVTNSITEEPVVITEVHPSCGCTTAQLPPLPWSVPAGSNGEIGVTVNVAGKFGTVVKSVHVGTDKGSRDLIVQITMLPPKIPVLTDADRIRQMAIAKVDRQAVFKNDCATCHVKNGQERYGKALFDADCGICHEAEHRASMVPDLHQLKVPTNNDFWRIWIEHGKPGTFMPAFAMADGGPLTDMQIASLVNYLGATIPSKVASQQ